MLPKSLLQVAVVERDTDTLHVPTVRARCQAAMRSGDSYKTENADDGKAKSRDTRATQTQFRVPKIPNFS